MLINLATVQVPPIRTILLVEDNAIDLAVAEALIRGAVPEATIISVNSHALALAALAELAYDFIIYDLNLPDSSGVEGVRQIASRHYQVPLLVYTAFEDTALAKEVLQAGAQDYLVKGRGSADTLRRIMEYSQQRKQVETQLHANQQMLQTFIRFAPAGIVVLDRQFQLVMASDRWLADHAVSEQEAYGKRFDRVVYKGDLRWRTFFDQCLRGEVISCPEDKVIRADGAEEYVRWEMLPWFDASGQVGGVIKFSEIVTEKRQMRIDLEEAKANLERKVEERTRELESAMMMAEGAQAAKNEFFANMTHELRTPLHAIINFSKFGMKKVATATPQKIEEYFTDIHVSGQRLLGLVNDLLDLTKHHYGKSSIEVGHHAIGEVFDEAVREMSSILESKQLRVEMRVDPEVHEGWFDRRRIHQVLVNLIGNAVKFSDPDTVIMLTCEPSAAHPRLEGMPAMLLISVKDQGVGIPEAELDSIFDEFAQSSKVKNGSFVKGTGLGLAICRQIVHAHQGLIWAENGNESGACLRVALPLEQEETNQPTS